MLNQIEKLLDPDQRNRIKSSAEVVRVFGCCDDVIDGSIGLDVISRRLDTHLVPPEPLRIRHRIKCAAWLDAYIKAYY